MPFSLSEKSCSSDVFTVKYFSKVGSVTFDEFWS